jgi:hypothetical protein
VSKHLSILIAVALFAATSQSVQAQDERTDNGVQVRWAYFTTSGNDYQAVEMVVHLFQPLPTVGADASLGGSGCTFVGEISVEELSASPQIRDPLPITLGPDQPFLITRIDFTSDSGMAEPTTTFSGVRNTVRVELSGMIDTPPPQCSIKAFPQLINTLTAETVGPVRCCGEACDCPPISGDPGVGIIKGG